ncbi:hypothetical protein CKAN_01361500 [Cinnamomum micranthum f. kanehirae]|uniref:Uncharacterized protein n=1 Tax=Cinnamomum micranthum f. kanehirae TaxID=337451 RepID=A0A3S3NCB4_9MAGN|nr:hypothetical protein CKAN_01361500 [Cinnamomum micranthum f. kanehirae]
MLGSNLWSTLKSQCIMQFVVLLKFIDKLEIELILSDHHIIIIVPSFFHCFLEIGGLSQSILISLCGYMSLEYAMEGFFSVRFRHIIHF